MVDLRSADDITHRPLQDHGPCVPTVSWLGFVDDRPGDHGLDPTSAALLLDAMTPDVVASHGMPAWKHMFTAKYGFQTPKADAHMLALPLIAEAAINILPRGRWTRIYMSRIGAATRHSTKWGPCKAYFVNISTSMIQIAESNGWSAARVEFLI